MVFNSPAFLFAFLPVCAALFCLMPGKRTKNAFLALASLVFYAFGGLAQVPVLLLSAAWNYGFGRALERESPRRKAVLILGAAGDLALLGVYKYLGFR